MKYKASALRSINIAVAVCCATISCPFSTFAVNPGDEPSRQRVTTNPLPLNYRFQFDEPSRREAADPVIEYFKGKYYLFASKSGGYWSSTDLCDWKYIPCRSIGTIEQYAPTILAYGDHLYYMASEDPQIYRTDNPDVDDWERVETKFRNATNQSFTDPALFSDDDGRVYLYWGCSNVDPIVGVEVDPSDGFRAIGSPKVLIEHHPDIYGWEVSGAHNDTDKNGWNEGPAMIKHNGRYYLQYASPGTEFRVYGDGVYVGDNPLGPFTYQESNPLSIKPGGFIAGAGHGHTFTDKHGNYWHVATGKISVRHMFERRIVLYPVFFDNRGDMHTKTVMGDYPFKVPDCRADFSKKDVMMPWNLLSYGKPIVASSVSAGHDPGNANDEQIETWWAATTGNSGEWLQLDLGRKMGVEAVHLNFADEGFMTKAHDSYIAYKYVIEGSTDGENWVTLVDESGNQEDRPHVLHVLDRRKSVRYLRVVNREDLDGLFSISGFRVFGSGKGKRPEAVKDLKGERDAADRRKITLDWAPVEGATGYVVRWGVAETGAW